MPQPVKNSTNYEKYLSNEIKNLIEDVVLKVAQDTVPANAITPEIFFIGALSYADCMLYKAVNGYLTTIKIDEIYDKLVLYSQDKFALSSARPNRIIDYSPEMRSLLQKANVERVAANDNLITSDHVLLAVLNEKTVAYDEIQRLFAQERLTYKIAKELSGKLHTTTNIIAESEEDDDNSALNKMKEGLMIGGADLAADDSGGVDSITIFGNIPDNVNPQQFMEQLKSSLNGVFTNSASTASEKKGQQQKGATKSPSFSKSLNDAAEKGLIDPIIGRQKEIALIEKVFGRRRCNNALLVGEPGVGKTAIVEGLARQIIDGNAPASLKDCKIFELNYSDMMAGTQFRGVFEDRLSTFIKEINKINNAILFIDNVHNIFSERQKSDYDFSGILSTLLSEANVRVIATTTPRGYHTTFETDPELKRKFQKITIDAPSIDESIEILNANKEYYEQYHGIKYSDDAIKACVTLSNRYITDRNLPSSAMDIMDEAGSSKKNSLLEPSGVKQKRNAIAIFKREKENFIKEDNIKEASNANNKIEGLKLEISKEMDAFKNPMKEKDDTVTVTDVYKAISEQTNIPLQKLDVSEKKALSNIDKILKKSIIGQDEAIDVVSRAIKRNKVGLTPQNRPIFSCICIGSTGTGKTLMAKKLAEEIFGDEKYLVRFDMSEYSDETAVNKLIGASAGYVGYHEGGLLTEAIKNKKHAVLLIDEIEKANEKIYNLFLQVLDEGFLTDNTGQKVDFRNTILIMTSNVGAKRAASERGIGFAIDENANKKDIIEKELKKKFPPEFINRIDEIAYFNNLTDDNLKDIIRLELNKLGKKIESIGHSFEYDNDSVDYVFDIIVKQKEYGARPILRAIQSEFENKITDLLIDNEYINHKFVSHVKAQEGENKKTLIID